MDRKVSHFLDFKDCPMQAVEISRNLEVAEDYLSRDSELATRLRVASSFLIGLDGLLLQSISPGVDWGDVNNSHDLYIRLKTILSKIKEAVTSGRVYSNSKDFDFSEGIFIIENRYHHVVSKLVSDYIAAGYTRKALDMAEEQYCLRSEIFGPADGELQLITLQICKILSILGELDRMLEYLDVAMDNIKLHPVSGKEDFQISDQLYVETEAFFICAASLPLAHPKRRDTFAYAFQRASECFETQIKCESITHEIKFRTTSFFRRIYEDGIEFDAERFLGLLQQTYDMYLSYGRYEELFDTTKDIVHVLSYIYERLRVDIISSSSVNWSVVTNHLDKFKLFVKTKAPLHVSQLNEQLVVATLKANSIEITRLELLLFQAQMKDFLTQCHPIFTTLSSYHPDFVGSRTVGADGTVHVSGYLKTTARRPT
jgi:hypothetical protein